MTDRVVNPLDPDLPNTQDETFVPSNRGKILAIVLGVLILVGGGIASAVVFGGGDDGGAGSGSALGTASPKAEEKIRISLVSTPTGARVYQGTKLIGTAPVSHQIIKRTTKVLFTFKLAGYDDERIAVTPDMDGKIVTASFPTRVTASADARAGKATDVGSAKSPAKPKAVATKPKAGTSDRHPKPKRTIHWPKPRHGQGTKPKPKPKPFMKNDTPELKNPFAK